VLSELKGGEDSCEAAGEGCSKDGIEEKKEKKWKKQWGIMLFSAATTK